MDIIQYLLSFIQYQHQQICWLLNFICRYIPLKQWAFDDSHSPKYQKFKVDKLPVIKTFIKQDWQFLLEYYHWKYGKPLKPVQRRNGKSIPEDTVCPLCELLTTLFTIIMAVTGSISARFVDRLSALETSSLYPFVSPALTVVTPLLLRKTVNFSAFINV